MQMPLTAAFLELEEIRASRRRGCVPTTVEAAQSTVRLARAARQVTLLDNERKTMKIPSMRDDR